ncbi:RnfABCDGE type electron transport complex subunit B [Legionella londiniensis]|uniref:Electron transport complex protein n=1 Tax=Legionella londiniensis TaxID=45068 RepID=A0A0W0VIB9_9GAMM|nr:RnfABCDGE type electron transport complex subunit B [Legionella londiniensis]KTD19834.1 electron transport complex protein [Legionella londiniensis]STX92253.1 iron-sulfur cluster binding protein [Legionella londiniensis]
MAGVHEIDALLPQTQCGECGYPGCRPYAEALTQKKAPIDRCLPGGVDTLKALGNILNQDVAPFLKEMQAKTRKPALAVIQETECIGCTKCIKACPVDAIVGAAKAMHHIINQECTGCGLCVEPCPVDCIEMVELPELRYDKDKARERFKAKQVRLLREAQDKQQAYRKKKQLAQNHSDAAADRLAKQNYIEQALARVKAKKGIAQSAQANANE